MTDRPLPSIVIDPALLAFVETVTLDQLKPWQVASLSALAADTRKHSGDDA